MLSKALKVLQVEERGLKRRHMANFEWWASDDRHGIRLLELIAQPDILDPSFLNPSLWLVVMAQEIILPVLKLLQSG